MDKNTETIYDEMPIIPEDIQNMTQKELDMEWEKIVKKHTSKDTLLTEEHKLLLKEYHIKFENIDINNLLASLDEEMLKYLGKNNEPTVTYLQLEKLYNEIYDINKGN